MVITKLSIPVLPVFGWSTLKLRNANAHRYRQRLRDAIGFPNGTSALAGALAHLEIGSTHEVILPGYNCPSMIEAVKARKATPVICKLTHDLSIDLGDLTKLVTADTRAVIAPSYFGFNTVSDQLVRFCRENDIALINDCAHAFFDGETGTALTNSADFSIFSAPKFFSGGEGGLLVGCDRLESFGNRRKTPLRANIKIIANTLEISARYKRLSPFNTLLIATSNLPRLFNRDRITAEPTHSNEHLVSSQPDDAFTYIDVNNWNSDIAPVTRFVLGRSDLDRIKSLRRKHYQRLAAEFSKVRSVSLLFPDLPKNTIPYMLPLLVDDATLVYSKLRELRAPVFRWDESKAGDCEISQDYASRLIQVACHQELSDADIQQTVDVFRSIVGQR